MRIGRTIPPAAAPLSWRDLAGAVTGMLSPALSITAREAEFRRYFGVPHVFLVSSGAAALTLALRSLKGSSPRMRVVVPAYTCFSVPAAIVQAGLQPLICDIDVTTLDFDYARLERLLDEHVLCVVAHHLFGIPADLDRLRGLCQRRGILVVEDAAQAMGIESRGRKLGTLGDVGIFSLGRGKQITCGGGGLIVTSSDRIAHAIQREWRKLESPAPLTVLTALLHLMLMAIFIRPSLYWAPAAMPFLKLGQTIFPTDIRIERLSGVQAGVLRHWRRRLQQSNSDRAETATALSRRLSLTSLNGRGHPYLRLPIFARTAAQRARLHSLSQQRGLGLSVAYPTPINEIPQISARFEGQRFPAARYVADHLLTLPTHHWLSGRDLRAIADSLPAGVRAIRPAEQWPQAS